ncbi:MAG: hypothetical protein IKV94_02535 [Clostridia bacterium]|nr:hypothetical protein [Clostridia bacterium]MBR6517107.1 hypothetical protein [Bacilli bacterium]
MEIKVGDYVRTKNKGIKKILDIGEYLGMTQYLINENGDYIIDNSIIKSSPNIIDLIEEDDYVNGFKVSFVDEEPVMGKFVQCDYAVQYGSTNHYKFYEKDIKSIVTKQQFSQMEYKISG